MVQQWQTHAPGSLKCLEVHKLSRYGFVAQAGLVLLQ